MKHITIFNPGDYYAEKIFGSDYHFNLFLEMLYEAYLVQYCFIDMDNGTNMSTNSIHFNILENGRIEISPLYDTKQNTIIISLPFLKKVIFEWLEFAKPRYKKVTLNIDIEKEIFECHGFFELTPEDEKLLAQPNTEEIV